jgi:hypothetical protein
MTKFPNDKGKNIEMQELYLKMIWW